VDPERIDYELNRFLNGVYRDSEQEALRLADNGDAWKQQHAVRLFLTSRYGREISEDEYEPFRNAFFGEDSTDADAYDHVFSFYSDARPGALREADKIPDAAPRTARSTTFNGKGSVAARALTGGLGWPILDLVGATDAIDRGLARQIGKVGPEDIQGMREFSAKLGAPVAQISLEAPRWSDTRPAELAKRMMAFVNQSVYSMPIRLLDHAKMMRSSEALANVFVEDLKQFNIGPETQASLEESSGSFVRNLSNPDWWAVNGGQALGNAAVFGLGATLGFAATGGLAQREGLRHMVVGALQGAGESEFEAGVFTMDVVRHKKEIAQRLSWFEKSLANRTEEQRLAAYGSGAYTALNAYRDEMRRLNDPFLAGQYASGVFYRNLALNSVLGAMSMGTGGAAAKRFLAGKFGAVATALGLSAVSATGEIEQELFQNEFSGQAMAAYVADTAVACNWIPGKTLMALVGDDKEARDTVMATMLTCTKSTVVSTAHQWAECRTLADQETFVREKRRALGALAAQGDRHAAAMLSALGPERTGMQALREFDGKVRGLVSKVISRTHRAMESATPEEAARMDPDAFVAEEVFAEADEAMGQAQEDLEALRDAEGRPEDAESAEVQDTQQSSPDVAETATDEETPPAESATPVRPPTPEAAPAAESAGVDPRIASAQRLAEVLAEKNPDAAAVRVILDAEVPALVRERNQSGRVIQGYRDGATGELVVVADNVPDGDLPGYILYVWAHEHGHEGLDIIFAGDSVKRDAFLLAIQRSLDPQELATFYSKTGMSPQEIAAMPEKADAIAVGEYLADLAGKVGRDGAKALNPKQAGIWERVLDEVRAWVRSLARRLGYAPRLTAADIEGVAVAMSGAAGVRTTDVGRAAMESTVPEGAPAAAADEAKGTEAPDPDWIAKAQAERKAMREAQEQHPRMVDEKDVRKELARDEIVKLYLGPEERRELKNAGVTWVPYWFTTDRTRGMSFDQAAQYLHDNYPEFHISETAGPAEVALFFQGKVTQRVQAEAPMPLTALELNPGDSIEHADGRVEIVIGKPAEGGATTVDSEWVRDYGMDDTITGQVGRASPEELQAAQERAAELPIEEPAEERWASDDTSFSLGGYDQAESAAWKEQLGNVAKGGPKSREVLRFGKTPALLLMSGADPLPMVMRPGLVRKATSGKVHNVPMAVIEDLHRYMADPMLITDSLSTENALMVVFDVTVGTAPVMAAVHLNSKEDQHEVNRIASVYERRSVDALIDAVRDGHAHYVNLEKFRAWVRSAGLQLPGEGLRRDKRKILHETDFGKPVSFSVGGPEQLSLFADAVSEKAVRQKARSILDAKESYKSPKGRAEVAWNHVRNTAAKVLKDLDGGGKDYGGGMMAIQAAETVAAKEIVRQRLEDAPKQGAEQLDLFRSDPHERGMLFSLGEEALEPLFRDAVEALQGLEETPAPERTTRRFKTREESQREAQRKKPIRDLAAKMLRGASVRDALVANAQRFYELIDRGPRDTLVYEHEGQPHAYPRRQTLAEYGREIEHETGMVGEADVLRALEAIDHYDAGGTLGSMEAFAAGEDIRKGTALLPRQGAKSAGDEGRAIEFSLGDAPKLGSREMSLALATAARYTRGQKVSERVVAGRLAELGLRRDQAGAVMAEARRMAAKLESERMAPARDEELLRALATPVLRERFTADVATAAKTGMEQEARFNRVFRSIEIWNTRRAEQMAAKRRGLTDAELARGGMENLPSRLKAAIDEYEPPAKAVDDEEPPVEVPADFVETEEESRGKEGPPGVGDAFDAARRDAEDLAAEAKALMPLPAELPTDPVDIADLKQVIVGQAVRKLTDEGYVIDKNADRDPVLRREVGATWARLLRKAAWEHVPAGGRKEWLREACRELELAPGTIPAINKRVSHLAWALNRYATKADAARFAKEIERLRKLKVLKGRTSTREELIQRDFEPRMKAWLRLVFDIYGVSEQSADEMSESLQNLQEQVVLGNVSEDQARTTLARMIESIGKEPTWASQPVAHIIDDALRALNLYGAVVHRSPAEIAGAIVTLRQDYKEGLWKITEARNKREEVWGPRREAIQEALRALPEADRETLSGKIGEFLQGNYDFYNGMMDMIRHAKGEVYAKAAAAIKEISLEINEANSNKARLVEPGITELQAAVGRIYKTEDVERTLRELMETKREYRRFSRRAERHGDLSRANLLMILAATDQEDYKENLAGKGRDDEYLAELRSVLSPADLEFLDWLRGAYKENRQAMSEFSERTLGVPVLEEDALYHPFVADRERMPLAEMHFIPRPVPPEMSSRRKHSWDIDERADVVSTFFRYNENRAQFMANLEVAQNLRYVFGHPDMARVMAEFAGAGNAARVARHVGEIMGGRVMRVPMQGEALISMLRGTATLAVMSWNIGSGLRQLSGAPAFGFAVGVPEMARAIGRELADSARWLATWKAMLADPAFREWANYGFGEPVHNAMAKVSRNPLIRFARFGMFPTRIGIMAAVATVAPGIYMGIHDARQREGYTDAESKRLAMREVMWLIHHTQGSSQVATLNQWYRGPEIGKLGLQFLGPMSQQSGWVQRAFRELAAGTPGSRRQAANALAVGFVLVPVVYQMFKVIWEMGRGDWFDDPEEEAKEAAWELFAMVLVGPMAGSVVFGSILEATINSLVMGKFGDVEPPAMEKAVDWSESAFKLAGHLATLNLEEAWKDADRFMKGFPVYREPRRVIENYLEED